MKNVNRLTRLAAVVLAVSALAACGSPSTATVSASPSPGAAALTDSASSQQLAAPATYQLEAASSKGHRAKGKALTPEQKAAFQARWEAFKSLTPEERKAKMAEMRAKHKASAPNQ